MVAKYDVGRLDSSGSTQLNGSNVSINTQEDTLNDEAYPLKFKVTKFEEAREATFPNVILRLIGRPTFAYLQRKVIFLLQRSVVFNNQ
ncbi:hypothetical protein ACFX13_009279 [Malus domestica]